MKISFLRKKRLTSEMKSLSSLFRKYGPGFARGSRAMASTHQELLTLAVLSAERWETQGGTGQRHTDIGPGLTSCRHTAQGVVLFLLAQCTAQTTSEVKAHLAYKTLAMPRLTDHCLEFKSQHLKVAFSYQGETYNAHQQCGIIEPTQHPWVWMASRCTWARQGDPGIPKRVKDLETRPTI